jgi:hypothetical protein
MNLDPSARRSAADYVRQLRRAVADLRSKEVESSTDAPVLLEKYQLTSIEQSIAAPAPKS